VGKGAALICIVNTLEEDTMIDSLHFEFEETENVCDVSVMKFTTSVIWVTKHLSLLCEALRTNHLNREERVSLIKICEEYSDVLYLPGDQLTLTTAAEHAIPTPTIDQTWGINTKPDGIPGIHREEVQKQTEQMLHDGIIAPWNFLILVVAKKADA